jgi:WD40 repeat protein
MVIKLTNVGQNNYMEGKPNDFNLSDWFNNPNILFTPTNKNGIVTLTTKPKFQGKLYSTLQSGKDNPNSLDEWFGWENDWSPDGKILAVGSQRYETNEQTNINSGRVYLYKLEELSKSNPQPFNILQRTDVLARFGVYVRWSPDGTKLAVGASSNKNNGSVFIYNLTDIIDKENPTPSVEINQTPIM